MATYMRVYEVGGGPDSIKLKGNASQGGHEKWIELEGFAYGAGDGDGSDSRISIEKVVDGSSCGLLDWATKGETYDLQIDCCRETGDPFMRVFLTEARLCGFSSNATPDGVTESAEILYANLRMESLTHEKDGQVKPIASASTGISDRLSRTEGVVVLDLDKRLAGDGASDDGPALDLEVTEQEDRVLWIKPVSGVEFELESFVGEEALSRTFRFQLELISEKLDVKPESLIGQKVTFGIDDDANAGADTKRGKRNFNGIVQSLRSGLTKDEKRRYSVVVVPEFWFFKKRHDCRIFQNKSVKDVIKDVFTKLSFSDYRLDLRESYPALEYCVQYNESDFDFVHRLMEENGIFYFFSHSDGKHEMVLADSKTAYAYAAQKDVIQTSGSAEKSCIRAWSRHFTQISGKTLFRDYDFTKPSDKLEATADTKVKLDGVAKYEVYDYPGLYEDVQGGRTRAKVRMEAEEAGYDVAEGSGTYESFSPGLKFKFEYHENSAEEKQEFALIAVRHKVVQLARSDKSTISYSNEFRCIPKDVLFRPESTTPRPSIPGLQTAKVVGTSGEEIDTDKYGCVKVKFPWDRASEANENSSCWIRVAQPSAGKNWGSIMLPRIGMEVVVQFENGNPDRPIVTGTLYNAEYMPPYALPDNKTQSGFKSRSSKTGKAEDFNELRFEDKKDSEQIYMHAQKDMERVVENDDTLTVGKDDEGSQTVTIEKDQTITINKGKRALTVKEGDASETVEAGDRAVTVTKGKDTKKVEGDRLVEVAKGKDTHKIKSGDRTVELGAGNDKLMIKQGNQTTELGMGNVTTTLKMGNQTTKLKLGKSTLDAMQGIELKVGQNKIKIDQTGITISGLQIKIEGKIQTEVKGLMCTVKGDAMLQAKGGITMLG